MEIGTNAHSTYTPADGWTEVSANREAEFYTVHFDGAPDYIIGSKWTEAGIIWEYSGSGSSKLLSIHGITDELTPVTVTDESSNLVETLSEAWPPSDEVAFGSVAFDLPDALVGVSETYKGVHPDNDNHTLYFDETGAYLGSAEFYTSVVEGVTNGYGVDFYDA